MEFLCSSRSILGDNKVKWQQEEQDDSTCNLHLLSQRGQEVLMSDGFPCYEVRQGASAAVTWCMSRETPTYKPTAVFAKLIRDDIAYDPAPRRPVERQRASETVRNKKARSWSPQVGLLTTVSWWRAGAGVAIRDEQGRAISGYPRGG